MALLFFLSRTVGPIPGKVPTSAASMVRAVAVVPLEGEDLRFAASSLALARGRGETFAGPEVTPGASARIRPRVEPSVGGTQPTPSPEPRASVQTASDAHQLRPRREPARTAPAAAPPSLPAPSRENPSPGREAPESLVLPVMEAQSQSGQVERPRLEAPASSSAQPERRQLDSVSPSLQQEPSRPAASAPADTAPSVDSTASASSAAPHVPPVPVPPAAETVSAALPHDGQPSYTGEAVMQRPAPESSVLQRPERAPVETPAVVADLSRPADASRLPVGAADRGSMRPDPEGLAPVAEGAPALEARERLSPAAVEAAPVESSERTYRDPSLLPSTAPAFSQRPLRSVAPADSDGLVVAEGESSDRLRDDPLRQASGEDAPALEVARVPDDKARLTPQPRIIVYPDEMRDVPWEGPVLVRVWPDEEGKVSRWEVDRPRGDERIAAAVEGVIHQWRFAVHPAWSLVGRPPPAVVVRLDPPATEGASEP